MTFDVFVRTLHHVHFLISPVTLKPGESFYTSSLSPGSTRWRVVTGGPFTTEGVVYGFGWVPV